MFGVARKLQEAGVLGLNERNSEFIMRLNPRALYPRVDDKVLTKTLAIDAGMAVPELYGVIANQGEVRRFAEIVQERDSFVVKPAQGSGGNGIIVVTGRSHRKRDTFRLASGLLVSRGEIEHHISNIVGGQYSLGGNPDKAIIEYCVRFDLPGRARYSGNRLSRLSDDGDGASADACVERQGEPAPGRCGGGRRHESRRDVAGCPRRQGGRCTSGYGRTDRGAADSALGRHPADGSARL